MRRKHHDLQVWQESIGLVTLLYKASSTFPKDELYALTSQLRRAAVSVPSNIAEGAARTSPKEFLYFLSIARGSLSELDTLIVIAKNLGYLNEVSLLEQTLEKVFALLGGLIRSLKDKAQKES